MVISSQRYNYQDLSWFDPVLGRGTEASESVRGVEEIRG